MTLRSEDLLALGNSENFFIVRVGYSGWVSWILFRFHLGLFSAADDFANGVSSKTGLSAITERNECGITQTVASTFGTGSHLIGDEG